MADSTPPSPPPPRRRAYLLIGALALLAVSGSIYAIRVLQGAPTAGGGPSGARPDGPPPAAVYVAPVQSERTREEALVTGSLRAVSRAEVAAREAGAILEVAFDEGNQVEAGQLLVSLDKRRIVAQLGEARARVTSAENLIVQREAEQKRAAEDLEMKAALLVQRAVSKSEILDAQRARAVADAQLDSAKGAVAEAKSRLEFLTVQESDLRIEAPFPGLIAERHVEPGEWVAAGQVVASLVTLDPVEAWLRVPARYLPGLSEYPGGLRVRISATGEMLQPSTVRIVPDVDPRSQLFTVVATLPNPKNRFAAGQSVTGIVPVGREEPHWVLPVDALIRTESGDFVFVVDEFSEDAPMPASRRISVAVAFERGGQVYLRAGNTDSLEKGDRVVVEGNDRLQPGQPLLVRDPSELQQPPKP